MLERQAYRLPAVDDRFLDAGRQERQTGEAPLVSGPGNTCENWTALAIVIKHRMCRTERFDQDWISTRRLVGLSECRAAPLRPGPGDRPTDKALFDLFGLLIPGERLADCSTQRGRYVDQKVVRMKLDPRGSFECIGVVGDHPLQDRAQLCFKTGSWKSNVR